MKPFKNTVITLAFVAALGALPAFASGDEPSPTPSATPHSEPSPSPTATPHQVPSPTPTPGEHHDPTPTPSPTPTPHHEPSPTASPSPTATPRDGDDDDDDGDTSGKSLHGLYEGTTSSGAIAVFYIENNTHVQINVFDEGSQTVGFAEGTMTNNAFTFALTNGQTIVGTATENVISGTIGGVTFQAQRASELGDAGSTGRFAGTADGPGGVSRVMFIIDATKHITMVQMSGTPPNITRVGGFGTVTAPVAPATNYTFVLNRTVGSSSQITGSFNIVDGVFSGTFTTSAGTFTVNSFKTTLVNKLANISTRGLVGSGDGQLIGGFIITGGPKLVIIRALGPSLAAAGVSPVLENPSVQLLAGANALASNDDWKTNANAAEIIATGIQPTNDLEAALLVRLEPGAYTTIVSGNAGSVGVGLVEIYEVGSD